MCRKICIIIGITPDPSLCTEVAADIAADGHSTRCYDIETFSSLLTLCEGNPRADLEGGAPGAPPPPPKILPNTIFNYNNA